MEMLRDKIRGLEGKIIEMLRHGQENVAIAERLHRWTRALMLTADAGELPDVLVRDLMHHFLVPQAAIRVWDATAAHAARGFATPVSADVKSLAKSLAEPYCGPNAGFEAAQWLEDAPAAKSLALIPLRHASVTDAFGMLVLASPDPTRYGADMGTEFLARIGELSSAALSRLLR